MNKRGVSVSQKALLVLVLSAYLILAAFYAVLVPPWETPDEPAHYRYVVQLAARWRPPTDPGIRQRDSFCRDYTFTTSNYEWYHPALGYLPLAVAYKILSKVVPYSLPENIPPFNPLFCSDPFTNPNLFHIETPRLLAIWRGQWGIIILRVFSCIWGLAVIYAAYQIGCRLNMRGFELVAAGWIAFLPQFTFISASIRNDTMANAISAVFFLIAAKMQSSSPHRNLLAVIMGLVLGMGILTKMTTAYLIPVALAAVAFSARYSRREWTQLIFYLTVPCLALIAGYYLYYPEAQIALSYMSAQMNPHPRSFSWAYWKPFFPMLVELFFARFGWANVRIPGAWIQVASGIWILGAMLSILYAIRLMRKKESRETQIPVITLLVLGIFLALIGVIRYNFAVFQPQGRFLFPAIVGWALLGTWGLSKVLPKWAIVPVGLALTAFMLIFNLRSLIAVASVYY